MLGLSCRIYDEGGVCRGRVTHNVIRAPGCQPGTYALEASPARLLLKDNRSGRSLCEINAVGGRDRKDLHINLRMYLPDGQLFEATPERLLSPGKCSYGIGTVIHQQQVGFNLLADGSIELGLSPFNRVGPAVSSPDGSAVAVRV